MPGLISLPEKLHSNLEFISVLPFLFSGVYLLSSNSFPALPPFGLPRLFATHYYLQGCVHFLNVTSDGTNESVGVTNDSGTPRDFPLRDLAFYRVIV